MSTFFLANTVLDSGLNILDTLTSHIFICSSQPTTYSQASTTFLLGTKSWGAGNVFGAPAASPPNGRKVTSIVITDGTITTSGTASWWAACGTASLHAYGTLSTAPQIVTAANNFTLAAFMIRIGGSTSIISGANLKFNSNTNSMYLSPLGI